VIAMQSLAVATALRLIVYSAIPAARSLHYFIVAAVLTAFSSVAWHADQIMPDVFTGLLAIFVFLIAWAWKGYGRPAQVALVVAACGISTLHYTHLPLSIGLFAVAALLQLTQGAGWRETRRVALIGLAVAAFGYSAFVAYSLALVHRPVLSPNSSIFLVARVLADGPGRDWLAASCPDSGNDFCKYRDRLPAGVPEFIWGGPGSPLDKVMHEVGPEQTRRAAAQIVWGAITLHPGLELVAAVKNSGWQLVRFGTLDTSCPQRCLETDGVSHAIKSIFPREYGDFRHSLQITGRLPIRRIRSVHWAVVVVSLAISLVLLFTARRAGDHMAIGFILLVATTLVLNAVLCGALSAPENRYQSRVVWLLPLSAMLGLARLWRQTSSHCESHTAHKSECPNDGMWKHRLPF